MDNIDNAAHELMEFSATGAWKQDDLLAYYHENRLYSVRDARSGIVSLVRARSPKAAIDRVRQINRPKCCKVISAEVFMEKVQHEAEGMNAMDADVLLSYTEWIMDKTPDVFSGEIRPDLPGRWIPTSERQPDPPKGTKDFWFNGRDVAADEYIVMIEGAILPTALWWTGKEWFLPEDREELTYNVIAWQIFPDPPSWALKDQNHEEVDPPFPEVMP